MADGGRIERLLRQRIRIAGRRYAEARQAYREGRARTRRGDVPVDEAGRSRIVCRRFAERRAVRIDAEARPSCFDAGHPDCEGCREDIARGDVETWEQR